MTGNKSQGMAASSDTASTPGHVAAAAALSLPVPLTPSKSSLSVARVSPALDTDSTNIVVEGVRDENMNGSQELDRALHPKADAGSHKGMPSISIDLSEFPPALPVRTPEEQDDATARKSVANATPDFLTQRLRSAIGQELLIEEGTNSTDEQEQQSDKGDTDRPALVKRQSSERQSSANEKGWRWSTFTTLPPSLKFENALQGLSLTTGQKPEQGGAAKVGESSAQGGSSFGPYMAALDVRKWFGSPAEPTEVAYGPSIKIQSPGKDMPSGSFPTVPRKRPNVKKHSSPVQSKADDSQRTENISETRKSNANIIEHDMTERTFGVQDAAERFPANEYLILSTAGKPIFWSKASKARLERAKERKARRRRLMEVDHDPTARQQVEQSEEEFAKKERELQDDEDQTEATRVGLLQAVISNFAETDKEKLHATAKEVLQLPTTGKVSFLLRPPLYLVAVAQWDDAESTLRNHLDHLYQAIISLVSATKLNRLFDRAANFDLRRLLQGTDNILDSLLNHLQDETIAMRGALQPLRLDAGLRHDVGTALMPSRNKQQRPQDALYALLLTRRGIITIARRRKNAIHPMDCHLLVNTVLSTKALKEGGTQSWVPICLPKFASQGFVYAHVSFLDVAEITGEQTIQTSSSSSSMTTDRRPDLGLVLITGNPDGFDEMSSWRERILHRMGEINVLHYLLKIAKESHPDAVNHENRPFGSYSADELGLPGLRHFCFKWRSNVQSTSSAFEEPYLSGTEEHKRLLCLYGAAHECVVRFAKEGEESAVQSDDVTSETDASSLTSTLADRQRRTAGTTKRSDSPPIVARSVFASSSRATDKATSNSTGHQSGLVSAIRNKLPVQATSSTHILKTANESVLAWSTANFELYLAASPHASRSALIGLAKGVVKWVKQEEHRLFIVSAPIF